MTMRTYLMATAGACGLLAAAPAQAQEYYLGQIIVIANSYCPKNTTEANGQILPIRGYTALFSLYGTTYGGNGSTTFQLPDLRGRTPINWGQQPGMGNYVLGQVGGAETVTLTAGEMPTHTHPATMGGLPGAPNTNSPSNASFADYPNGLNIYAKDVAPNVAMAANTAVTLPTGNSQPIPLRSPYQVLRYCVVLAGYFPQRP